MTVFSEKTFTELFEHAQREAPRECCGLVIVRKGKERFWPCRNVSSGADQFQIDPRDYAEAEEQGEVMAIAHSHVNISPQPSQADLVSCEATQLPWIIVNVPVGTRHVFEPSGYEAPLIGCQFSHGVNDCYALIQRYYQRELGITLPDFARQDDWWKTDQDLYRDNFSAAGFMPIDASTLRLHDVILMQLSANKTNHGAVYLGDGKILHHPMNRLSGRDVFGGYWQSITTFYLRHRELA